MSANRYLIGSRGVVLYALETDPYTEETDIDDFDEMGYTTEDFEPPNENPHTPLPTGGVDGPYINSPDPPDIRQMSSSLVIVWILAR